jgi:hypothetical protein
MGRKTLDKVDKKLLYEDEKSSKPKVSNHKKPKVEKESEPEEPQDEEPQEEEKPRTPMKSEGNDIVAPMPQ